MKQQQKFSSGLSVALRTFFTEENSPLGFGSVAISLFFFVPFED